MLVIRDWRGDDDPEDEGVVTAIGSAPRRTRVQAAHKLPELLAKMRERARAEATAVREAKDAAEAFLRSLPRRGET
jgi:hypothetical protein